MATQHGILAIWNDCRAGREAEFETWFQGEHLAERLAVPGFLFGRRHQAISGSARYFNFYLTETPDVLTSKAYLDRVDNPTPMTRKVMSEIFMNMNRTVCRRTQRYGSFRGAFAVTARFNGAADAAALSSFAGEFAGDLAVAACEVWSAAVADGVPTSTEEKLRGGDKKITACLMADTLHQDDAEKIGERMARQYPQADVGVFRVLCHAGRESGT